MKVLAGVLFAMFVAVVLVLVAVIQLIVQLMPLLIMGAVAYGVVVAVKHYAAARPIAPPGFMLVPVPPPPASGPQLALPPPRRNPVDVEVFGPLNPGDSGSPDRWQWR